MPHEDGPGEIPVWGGNRGAAILAASSAEVLRPKRAMGFVDLVLFYVVTGISLRWIATAASAGPSAVIIWFGAWLTFYTPLALSVIELSSRNPQQGGLYVWSKRAFGDFAGFQCAWIYWTSNLPYFPAVLYFAGSNLLYVRGERWSYLANNVNFYIVFSIVTLAVITMMNVIGLDVGKWLHNVGALAMWLPVVIIVGMGAIAWHRFGSATTFSGGAFVPSTHLKDMIFWSTLTFAFGGCETASFMAEEIKNTRRTIPFALFTGGLVVTFCYVMGTVGVLAALPRDQVSNLQGLMQAITRTAGRVGFFWIIPVAAGLIALSNLGAAGAYLAAVARLPFVAGIDRFLPPVFGKLHPRWGTPYVALILQGLCGVLFIFLGQAGTTVKGAYDVLVSLGVITYFLPYLFLFAAMFRLQREPAGPEVIRVPGGRPVARLLSVVGFTTAFLTIALSFVPSPGETNPTLAILKVTGGTVILLAIGALLYWAGKRASGASSRTVGEFDPAASQ
ncbi:MAG TPA: APC family permease [Terriglobales bacterium]|nr:APC family permease [Terriglobales bacterium]